MARHTHPSTLLGGIIAVMTLIVIMLMPLLGNSRSGSTASSQNIDARLTNPHLAALENQRTALIRVDGAMFFQGTMPDEAESAAALCATLGFDCDVNTAEDSYPPHNVLIETFWMEVNEVTYGQYVTFLNTLGPGAHLTGCSGQPCVITQTEDATSSIVFNGANYTTSNPAIDDYPVVDVTWYGAQAYCETLGRRLPTEAEWEFAARGTDGTVFPWGNEWNPQAANVRGSTQNDNGVIIAKPQPVGAYPQYASRDGIRDLAGNVAEWVADWYDADHYLQVGINTTADIGPETGTTRVIRGGSWDTPFFYARSAHRASLLPLETSSSVGFRCVADN